MSISVAFPEFLVCFINLPPPHVPIIQVPRHMMIQSPAAKFSSRLIATGMRVCIVVFDVEIAVVEETIDQHQIMRLIARMNHGPRERKR